MKTLAKSIGVSLLVLAAVVAIMVAFGPEVATLWHGAPPPDERVRADFEQALRLPNSAQKAHVKIRRTGIADRDGKWVRMYATFDVAPTTDMTINVGTKPIHLKGGISSIGGEVSLEYSRDTSTGAWNVIHVTLDREPKPE
jgi:hypothetical protein